MSFVSESPGAMEDRSVVRKLLVQSRAKGKAKESEEKVEDRVINGKVEDESGENRKEEDVKVSNELTESIAEMEKKLEETKEELEVFEFGLDEVKEGLEEWLDLYTRSVEGAGEVKEVGEVKVE